MAQKWNVKGPGIWKLILSLAEGKKIQFTFNPAGTTGGNFRCEAQLRTWHVVGAHKEHNLVLSGVITDYKYPKDIKLTVSHLNFSGPYDAKTNTGEFIVTAPDES